MSVYLWLCLFLLPEPCLWIHSWGSRDHFIPSIFVRKYFYYFKLWACASVWLPAEVRGVCFPGARVTYCHLWAVQSECQELNLGPVHTWTCWATPPAPQQFVFILNFVLASRLHLLMAIMALTACSFMFFYFHPCIAGLKSTALHKQGRARWATSSRPWCFAASSLKLRFVSDTEFACWDTGIH